MRQWIALMSLFVLVAESYSQVSDTIAIVYGRYAPAFSKYRFDDSLIGYDELSLIDNRFSDYLLSDIQQKNTVERLYWQKKMTIGVEIMSQVVIIEEVLRYSITGSGNKWAFACAFVTLPLTFWASYHVSSKEAEVVKVYNQWLKLPALELRPYRQLH